MLYARLMPTVIKTIFVKNGMLVIKTEACEVNKSNPDTAFSINPAAANLPRFLKVLVDNEAKSPSRRRSRVAKIPTTMANPTMWTLSRKGYAHKEVLTHDAIKVFSKSTNMKVTDNL